MKQIVCPISNEQVNERLTRLNALFTVLLVTAGFVFNSVWFPLLLTLDFFIRSFASSRYSPVSVASTGVAKLLQLSKKPIDKAPKMFAARMGFLMTLTIAICFMLNLNTAAVVIAAMLVFFATLEFAFGLCVGCIIYTYFVLPLFK
jgi:hypothetical protein